MNNKFIIDKKIKLALDANKPIVALESSLISHGFPYPQNIEVAKSSIEAIKKTGSIPATIGIIKGKIKVGLNEKDIEFMAKNSNIEKVSVHNLVLALSNKKNAATTVASSIYIAEKLKIKFFATGGIGGVHRNAEKSFDVSSDLYQLSKSKLFIICSGAKSILDLDKTYELLETLGITRIGYKTKFMPGFWYSETHNQVDNSFNQISKISNFLKLNEKIKHNKSILIFNKVPEKNAISKDKINQWIKNALINAQKLKICGKELTPFLIKEINKFSDNQTLDANIALILDNANLAGKIAKDFYS